ncbi:hypothetical protein [Sphingobacterium sp. MYb382]|uniref:hypothetical protein n=1 Tax=Sphingobacterium sp. MYb382 TaxID=2745278 RepID=UPI0030B65BD5
MKKINLAILFSLLSFMTFAQSLDVVIKQDGKEIQPVNNVYELAKTPFSFVISGVDIEGFLVGATTNEEVYEEAVAPFNPDVQWFQNTGMAEELFNPYKELYLMDQAPSFWYFVDAKDHRFDKNAKGDVNQWKGTRTITRLYDIIIDEAVALKDFEGSVYVLMYDPEYDEDFDMVGKENLFQAQLKFKD